MTEINIEERMHCDVKEHKHTGYDYWHPTTRVHAESTKDELPAGHVLNKKPLAEKLSMDLVEVTPIQKMGIGKDLEIGAVQSLMEGLQHHRYVASTLLDDTLFYAEWTPNHSTKVHRYLIAVKGEEVYVGYFPYDGDGRKPRLYGIHHRKQDIIKFLHKTHNPVLQLPELTLLTAELNIPNISFGWAGDQGGAETSRDRDRVNISHKQGTFFTRSLYGEFTPLSECKFIPDPDSGDTPETVKGHWDESVDATGYNMGDPTHPWYMFQGATGYVQLFEGKMFCYPDGSIRFLPKDQEETVFRGYTDLQIVQGDLVAYEGVASPNPDKIEEARRSRTRLRNEGGGILECLVSLDRHTIKSDKSVLLNWGTVLQIDEDKNRGDFRGEVYVTEDCILSITHPEHGEIQYEARKGEMLALLPGTSRPFQKVEGRD